MKILTKKWAEKHEQLRVIHLLKEYDAQKITYEQLLEKSKDDFYSDIAKDIALAKVCLKTNCTDELYKQKIERNKKALFSLPKEIFNEIKDVKTAVLGYACCQDIKFLTAYAETVLKIIENDANEANRLTERAESFLKDDFVLDDVVGELVYEEYSNDKDYFININGYDICIEDFEIIEREDFRINERDNDNPLSSWTSLHAAELHYVSENQFELHLLLFNGDMYLNETPWYFTLKGTSVKFMKEYE